MKTTIVISLLVACSLQGHCAPPAQGTLSPPTLALYLVAGEVSGQSLQDGTATPAGMSLRTPPILSDADFVAWDITNHTLVITPTAAKRVIGRCADREVPFVLVSDREPVYVGLFETGYSSRSAAVPVIMTDSVLSRCFMGWTNVPPDVLHMIALADAGVTDRLLALTNATTNVTLRIERGYPAPDGFGRGMDRRDDKRIAIAVEKLFGEKRN